MQMFNIVYHIIFNNKDSPLFLGSYLNVSKCDIDHVNCFVQKVRFSSGPNLFY